MSSPQGGAAQHVATQLEAKLRDHLKSRNNLFNESSRGLAASLTRPLLCLFDRNFELSVVLQVRCRLRFQDWVLRRKHVGVKTRL